MPPQRWRVTFDDGTTESVEATSADAAMQQFRPAPVKEEAKPTSGLTTAQKIVRQSAAPAILGAVGGAFLGPFGLAGGAVAGEAINQYVVPDLVGSEPSILQMGLAGAGGAVGPTGRLATRLFPGAAPGLQQAMQRVLGPNGSRIMADWGADEATVAMLYNRVRQSGHGVMIGTDKLKGGIQSLSQNAELNAFMTSGQKNILKRAGTLVENRAQIPFEEFAASRTGLGEIVRTLERKGGTAHGLAKKLYKDMSEQLDESIVHVDPKFRKTYALAVEARKRMEFSEFMSDYWSKALRTPIGFDEYQITQVLQKTRRDEEILTGLIGKKGYGEVVSLLQSWAKTPISSTVGQDTLRGIAAPERIVMGAGLEGLNAITGSNLPPGVTGIGAVLGVEMMSRMLATAPGRFVVRNLQLHGYGVDQATATMMHAIRTGGWEYMTTGMKAGTFNPKDFELNFPMPKPGQQPTVDPQQLRRQAR